MTQSRRSRRIQADRIGVGDDAAQVRTRGSSWDMTGAYRYGQELNRLLREFLALLEPLTGVSAMLLARNCSASSRLMTAHSASCPTESNGVRSRLLMDLILLGLAAGARDLFSIQLRSVGPSSPARTPSRAGGFDQAFVAEPGEGLVDV